MPKPGMPGASRRAGLWHPQKRHGLQALPPPGPAQCRQRVAADRAGLQLRVAPPPAGRVINISGDATRCWWTECDGLVASPPPSLNSTAQGDDATSLGTILIIALLGGFSDCFGGYGYGFGHSGVGVLGEALIVLVVLLRMGRL